jgi:hypothetical protein
MDRYTGRLVGHNEIVAEKYNGGFPVDIGDREALWLQVNADILPASYQAIGSDALALMIDRSEGQEPLCFGSIQTERFKTVEQGPVLLDPAVPNAPLCCRCR